MPFGENAAIKHLLFDTRHNIYSNILWMKGPSVIGTHKHRGYIVMVCLEGSAHYLEYKWLATPGCFIYETPGEATRWSPTIPMAASCLAGCRARTSSMTRRAIWS